jgi:very-short-patch-repair endonuclease
MTPQEVKLWSQLRKLRPQGFHFRRQAPLEGYVLDFVCFKFRMIVEVDGSQHGEETGLRHDAHRDAVFTASGFCVLRFWNHEVDADLNAVIETIIARASERCETPTRRASRATLPARGRDENGESSPAVNNSCGS